MQFLKKNYEKILLGLVLAGLVVAVGFLPFLVQNEKEAQQSRTTQIITRKPKELPPLDLTRFDELLKRVSVPMSLDLSSTNKLFNSERWQRTLDGRLIKVPRGREIEKLEITKITPLYFIVTLDRIEKLESEVRYGIVVDHQGERNGRRGPLFISKLEPKKEYPAGDKKESLTLAQVAGETDNPTLTVELSDSGDRVSISTNAPFKRVEGYVADLKYSPDNKSFRNCRVGSLISFGGTEYNIVAISQNEVVLSAKPNDKKYTIRYNAGS